MLLSRGIRAAAPGGNADVSGRRVVIMIDEKTQQELIRPVVTGRASRREFLRSMVALGLTAPMVNSMLATYSPATAQARQAKEIVIGGTIAQSGRFLGIVKPFPKMMDAWIKRVNDRGGIYLSKLGKKLPLRLILEDDQSSPPTALKFYERLATVDKVHLFIGPFSSFVTNAALQAAVTHNIPMFMVEANDSVMFEKPNKWRAAVAAPAQWEYKRVAELYEKKRGVKTFALFAMDNLHDKQSMEGFGEWLTQKGFEVVYKDVAPRATKDFSSIVLAIKGKNPDVVFVEGIVPPFTIGFLKQARELGLNPKDFIVGHMPFPVIKAMGKSSENIVSALYSYTGDTADHKEFSAQTEAAGFKTWQYSESGIRYATFKWIEASLEKAGSLDPEDIRQAMWDTTVSVYDGGLIIKHDERGYGAMHPWPVQIKGGKPVSLWPLDQGVQLHQFKNGQW